MADGTGAVAISCVGLTKVFPVVDAGSFWRVLLGCETARHIVAVDQVSLAVPKGTIAGILGRNGAGKSTLLRLIGGVYTPSAGQIRREGTVAGLFELGGGGNQFLTGRDFARRALALRGVRRRAIADHVEEIHEFSELGPAFEEKIFTYSTGMTARLYFAAATALHHDVYLIDELLAVGDEHFQAKCWRRIRDRLSGGASGILVTHDWSAALRICKETHVMEGGRIVKSGLTATVVREYLNLERPRAKRARFSVSNPTRYVAEAGRDTELAFSVEIEEPAAVAFAYSIEMLRHGEGWQILLLEENLPVADEVGRYVVRLQIPRLPLPAGHYCLNVFLGAPRLPGQGDAPESYDARSWTYGNAFDLLVEGSSEPGAVVLPLEWEPLVAGRPTHDPAY